MSRSAIYDRPMAMCSHVFSLFLASSLFASTTTMAAQPAFTIVLNRYATTAVQVAPLEDDQDAVVFRYCQIAFSGPRMESVAANDCKQFGLPSMERTYAFQILQNASVHIKDSLSSLVAPERLTTFLNGMSALTAGLATLTIALHLTNLLGFTNLNVVKSKKPVIVTAVILALISGFSYYQATQIAQRTANLQTSLRILTSEVGEVFIVQEVFPSEKSDESLWYGNILPQPAQLKSDAVTFSEQLKKQIETILAQDPNHA